MALQSVLIANRGEIAIRVTRAAAALGLRTVAVYSDDDVTSLHTKKADEAHSLGAAGPAAYLDIDAVLRVAQDAGCNALHPGYGFLSENPQLARRCADQGIVFVGPTPETLELFGDKAAARGLAEEVGVPVLAGTPRGISVEAAAAFLASLGPGPAIMLKATAGGGGRGQRIVTTAEELPEAFARCQSEAVSAFGDGSLFAEQLLAHARHVEVQIVGDGAGTVIHLFERECSIQRRQQKIVEVAPAPNLSSTVRDQLTMAAVRMAARVGYRSLGTFEFLVAGEQYYFLEANPRLQVEHTVTEEVLGVDLVRTQLEIAGERTLVELGLEQASVPSPRGFAVQCRVNMETMGADGAPRPGGGVISAFEVPSGPGWRTDSFGYAGYRTSPRFDSLLAKVIVHSPSPRFDLAVRDADRALQEMRVEGVPTNIGFLQAILEHPTVQAGEADTRFVDDHLAELLAAESNHPKRYFSEAAPAESGSRRAGVRLDSSDPLAVLALGRQPAGATEAPGPSAPPEGQDGWAEIASPLQGTVVQIDVADGDPVRVGQQLLVMEAMKMEHVVAAPVAGFVRRIGVARGDAVFEGHPLVVVEPADLGPDGAAVRVEVDLDEIRPDLAEVLARHALTLDAARPDAVAKRRRTGQRTAMENINDLCDPDSFVEHGALVVTPGTGLPMEQAMRKFPNDAIVCGVGSINGSQFDADTARTVVLSYDYTVLAGTQGPVNHEKTDRLLELAQAWKMPVVFFCEGGGGRAGTGGNRSGDEAGTPTPYRSRPFRVRTFATMGRLSGVVPTVGINSRYCFAGNASILGMCDVIIATKDSNIGMGGPAMIEGGGLGVFAPTAIGPIGVQLANGVVDIAVEDEEEAVAVAKQYLSYFQGTLPYWSAADQRQLRSIVPENRLRTYDMRKLIETLADTGSVLELRRHYGLGMVTALARIEGRPVGILANNPSHLAGAVDSEGSIKAVRFMQLLDAFDIPLVVLCDTPGIMVGPESEKTGAVRHCNQLFITGAQLSVPSFAIVVRKAIGLGAMAMVCGSGLETFMTVSWPTGEFAGMGLEGQVKLGYRNELEAIEDPTARVARYEELVADAYERSKALNAGVTFHVDDVIDPMDTRRVLSNGLRSVGRQLETDRVARRLGR